MQFAVEDKPFTQSPGGWRGFVFLADWGCRVALPIHHNRRCTPIHSGDLSLKQSKIEALFSKRIPQCFQCVRIKWPGTIKSKVTERQHRNETASALLRFQALSLPLRCRSLRLRPTRAASDSTPVLARVRTLLALAASRASFSCCSAHLDGALVVLF